VSIILNCKISCKMMMSCKLILDEWKVHVSHIFMRLPLQLGVTYCLLQQKIYATCNPKQLGLVVVTCGNYNKKLVVNVIVDLQIPCSDSLTLIMWHIIMQQWKPNVCHVI
jgi:hypothetical protein